MAATPKPLRELGKKQLKSAKAVLNKKNIPKKIMKDEIKNVKKMSKEESKYRMKKHSKEDLAKANAHMKKHGG